MLAWSIVSAMTCSLHPMSEPRNEAAVEEFFGLFAQARKTNNGAAVSNLLVEDGALIKPFGQGADGRADIGAVYVEYFAGMLRHVDHLQARKRAPVEADHALPDGEQTISAGRGEVVLVAHLAALPL